MYKESLIHLIIRWLIHVVHRMDRIEDTEEDTALMADLLSVDLGENLEPLEVRQTRADKC